MATCELMKEMRRLSWRYRHFHGDQQFLRLKRSFVDPGEELACRNPPLAVRPASNHGGAKREHAGRQLGSRVRVGKAAPDGASVTDRWMGDMGNRIRQQGRMGRNFRRSQEIGVACQRTDGDDAFLHHHSAQLVQLADIDDEFGRDQAQIHRRHQALAARQAPWPFRHARSATPAHLRRWSRGHKRKPRLSFWHDLPGQFSAFLRD